MSESAERIVFEIEDHQRLGEEIDEAMKYAESKLKHVSYRWDYEKYEKSGRDLLIAEKAKPEKCPMCGKMEVLDFEYDNGYEVLRICALCWLRTLGRG